MLQYYSLSQTCSSILVLLLLLFGIILWNIVVESLHIIGYIKLTFLFD